MSDQFTKPRHHDQQAPLSDEGADFRDFLYAVYGQEGSHSRYLTRVLRDS